MYSQFDSDKSLEDKEFNDFIKKDFVNSHDKHMPIGCTVIALCVIIFIVIYAIVKYRYL